MSKHYEYVDLEFEGKGVDTYLVSAYNLTLGRKVTDEELEELDNDIFIQEKAIEYNLDKYGYMAD